MSSVNPASASSKAITTMYASIWDRLKAKGERYEETDIVSGFPPLHHFSPDAVWVGAFSRTIPAKKWRMFHKDAALNEGGTYATPPQITRAYLDEKFPAQLRAKKSQLEFWTPRRAQPMYSLPDHYHKEMTYLDLRSAYWSIVQIIGWDVDYFPALLARRHGVEDFPYGANRMARNSLITLGLPSKGYLYKDGHVTLVKHGWKVNIGLWTAVQDILHGIADDMIRRAGAVYVNTDGYIIPSENYDVALGISDEWGLPIREKYRGRATVYGVGAYSIGKKICSRNKRLAPAVQAVYPRHKDALKRQMRFLSERYLKD